jgi:hypothetical protein
MRKVRNGVSVQRSESVSFETCAAASSCPHMMEKASMIWSKEIGLDRNPSDLVEVRRPDDSRERFLSKEELERLKVALDEKMFRKGTKDLNRRIFG